MNADRLLALYDKVAEAPEAISRLRRFVLDLAVRGKLVAQDPNDEPASKLMRIAAAKVSEVQKRIGYSGAGWLALGAVGADCAAGKWTHAKPQPA